MKKLMFLTMMFGMFLIATGNVSAQNVSFGYSQTAVFQSWSYQSGLTLPGIGEVGKVDATFSGSQKNPCSKDGGKQMNISWKNNTKMTLRINWINSACKEENNDREIKPGDIYDGVSYEGHWFIIRDYKTNKQVGYREVKPEYANMGIPK